jgi:hypothetical protein
VVHGFNVISPLALRGEFIITILNQYYNQNHSKQKGKGLHVPLMDNDSKNGNVCHLFYDNWAITYYKVPSTVAINAIYNSGDSLKQ